MKTNSVLDNKLFNFSEIRWLLKDEKHYHAIIDFLRERSIFKPEVWQFAFLHNDVRAALEWIKDHCQSYLFANHRINVVSTASMHIESIDLYEYFPLLSNRSHRFMNRSKQKILNKNLKSTYTAFLTYLLQLNKLRPLHYVVWCYYLLLQDRLEETLEMFKKIDAKDVSDCQLQYDYMSCYLDVQAGFPHFKTARLIVEKYLNYPVLSWRKLFRQLKGQLDEFDGDQAQEGADLQDAEISKNEKSLTKEEVLSAQITTVKECKKIEITYNNLKQLQINYYVFDLELLFSIHPFIKQNFEQFGLVHPNLVTSRTLDKSAATQTLLVDLPEEFAGKNLFIQITGMSQKVHLTHFSNVLQV